MSKKVLIISPYFPPCSAADMQRIRMSLNYFKEFNWEAEVVTVDEKYCEINLDNLLTESIPNNVKVHKVKALNNKWTSKLGLGNIALRSIWFYLLKVNSLLKHNNYDLIYFSTTQFSICILGVYWKKKFNIPFLIDMQDPWHSEYYQNKPKRERPRKYWFSYRLNKYLESFTLKRVGGLISVSDAYIKTIHNRYSETLQIPSAVITFGAFEKDFNITKNNGDLLRPAFQRKEDTVHVVYVGRGGNDMRDAVKLFFSAFKKGLVSEPTLFRKLFFYFIGTSYAPNGLGKPTIRPLAAEMGISEFVEERTDRIDFYSSIATLLNADALFIPGSDDPKYTASKLFPYILTKKPLVAIFNPESSVTEIIQKCNAGSVFNLLDKEKTVYETYSFLINVLKNPGYENETDWEKFSLYSAENMTRKQCELFDMVIKNK